jgi:drug/metabolite transporter (DMT)-like permease
VVWNAGAKAALARPPLVGCNEVMANSLSLRAWGLLIVLAAIWATPFLFYKVLLGAWHPLTIAAARVALAGAALAAVALLRRDRFPRDAATWLAFVAMGVLNNVIPFAAIAWSETRISSGLASVFNATTPLFAVLLAHVVTADEKLTANRVAGIVLGIAGVTIIVGPDALRGLGGDTGAALACLAAALSYALAGIFGRRFRGLPLTVAASGQLLGATLISVPLALALDRPWTAPPLDGAMWLSLIGLAIVCTSVGYLLYFRILALAGATNLMLVTLLIPVGALALGALVLGERLTTSGVAGALSIGLGLLAVDGRVLRRFSARNEEIRRAA